MLAGRMLQFRTAWVRVDDKQWRSQSGGGGWGVQPPSLKNVKNLEVISEKSCFEQLNA